MRTLIFLLTLALALGGLAACGGSAPNTGYETVTQPAINVGDAVPAPSGPVVLTLKGKIGQTNAEGRLDFDMETLEKLGLITFAVNDPYLLRNATYEGVLLSRLLDVAKVPADATTLSSIAINDYKTDVPISVARQWPVMLATKLDGARMSVADKGPLEIVFPYESFEIDRRIHDPMWVWQLRSIEVR